jgi:hypothetical protein
MEEVEIDSLYLDGDFIYKLNDLGVEKLSGLVNAVLDIYEEDLNNEKLTYITKVISNLIGQDIDGLDFFRKLRYLIKKGVYNRWSKKFKSDLLELGFAEGGVDNVIESAKEYLDKLNEVSRKQNTPDSYIKDFELTTEMPIYNNNLNHQELNDTKKQNIVLKLDIENKGYKEKNLISMNKGQLVSFYKEIERIQEKLDKLY